MAMSMRMEPSRAFFRLCHFLPNPGARARIENKEEASRERQQEAAADEGRGAERGERGEGKGRERRQQREKEEGTRRTGKR